MMMGMSPYYRPALRLVFGHIDTGSELSEGGG